MQFQKFFRLASVRHSRERKRKDGSGRGGEGKEMKGEEKGRGGRQGS
jgi:hypothetical protein